jgi:hypothetical protein
MRGRTRHVVILTAVSVALLLPAIFGDLFNDDYLFTSPLIERQTTWNAYEMMDRRNPGLSPWWIDDGFQMRLMRPLSSATLRADFGLLGGSPLVAHIHSILWFVVFLLGGFALLGRLLEGRSLTLAMVVLALASFTTWAAGWIAARHAIMGGAFCIWSALFYLRWRRGEPAWTAVVAFALFVLGLLSSESGVALVGFVVSYELIMAEGALGRRLLSGLPIVATAFVYLIIYKLLGYGATGSGAYADPVSEPVEYLTLAVPKTLALLGTFTLGVPAMMRMIPDAATIPTVAGVLALLLLGLGFWVGRKHHESGEHRLVGWLAVMVPLSMAPALSGLVEGRGVLLSGVGFAAICGVILRGLFTRRGALAWLVALPLCFGVLVMAPLGRLAMSSFLLMGGRELTAIGEEAPSDCRPGARVYVVNGDAFTSIGAPYILARHRGWTFAGFYQLALATDDLTLERTGPEQLRLRREAGLYDGAMRLFREDFSTLGRGTRVEQPGLRVEVVEANASGPTAVDFTIEGLADPAQVCLLTIDQNRLHHVELPEVGASTQITFSPPQMGGD